MAEARYLSDRGSHLGVYKAMRNSVQPSDLQGYLTYPSGAQGVKIDPHKVLDRSLGTAVGRSSLLATKGMRKSRPIGPCSSAPTVVPGGGGTFL